MHSRPDASPRAGERLERNVAKQLLQIWEEQQGAPSVQRVLHLLDAMRPGEAWLHASIGARDAALMRLQQHLFGGALSTTTACPGCGARLESEFRVDDVCTDIESPAAHGLCFEQLGYTVDYRLPDSADLLALSATGDEAQHAARRLMQRCVSRARRHGEEIDAATLPDAVVQGLGTEMAARDPDADVRLALRCPECGSGWQSHFDIVSYLWDELDDWAQRVLADVHMLARAYGWSEDAILALGPLRRRMYLDMVAA